MFTYIYLYSCHPLLSYHHHIILKFFLFSHLDIVIFNIMSTQQASDSLDKEAKKKQLKKEQKEKERAEKLEKFEQKKAREEAEKKAKAESGQSSQKVCSEVYFCHNC